MRHCTYLIETLYYFNICWKCIDRSFSNIFIALEMKHFFTVTIVTGGIKWVNKHHGKKDILGSVQQWSTSPRLIQTACSIRPQTCTFHIMSCTWPNCSTPVYVKQLQRRKQRLVLLMDSQRWFLYPLFFLISEALSGSSTVPQRVLMPTVMKD